MTALATFRARYVAERNRRKASHDGSAKAVSRADGRARMLIERWQNGETHKQIAESLGIKPCSVTQAIAAYRKRHPDIDLRAPLSAQRKGGGAIPPVPSPTKFVPDQLHSSQVSQVQA